MADHSRRRLAYAQKASGLRPGQRVRMSLAGSHRLTGTRVRRLAGEFGTIVSLSSSLAAWVQWDNFKAPRCISIHYLDPITPVAPGNPDNTRSTAMTEVTLDPTCLPDLEDAAENEAANRIAMRLAEDALEDPLRGTALLRSAAILMAYLAAHEPDSAAALQDLINEQVSAAQQCLEAMRHPTPMNA